METEEQDPRVAWKEDKRCMEAELNSLKLQLETEKWERSLLEMQHRQVLKELMRVYERIEKVACIAGMQGENKSDNHVTEKFDWEITCRRLEAVCEKLEANWRYCEAFGQQICRESEKMESFVQEMCTSINPNLTSKAPQPSIPQDVNASNPNLMRSPEPSFEETNLGPVFKKSITAGDIIKRIFDFPQQQPPAQQCEPSQNTIIDTESSACHLHPKELRLQNYGSMTTKENKKYKEGLTEISSMFINGGVVKQVSPLHCKECPGTCFGSTTQLKLHQKLQHKREN